MILLYLLLGFIQIDVPPLKLRIQPLDLHENHTANPVFLSDVNQLETDGVHIYLRSISESSILVLDETGSLIRKMGREGEGPGEFANFITAISVDPSTGKIWTINNYGFRCTIFDGTGTYIDTFKISRLPYINLSGTSNVFASHNNTMVYSGGGNASNHPLGLLYDFKNEKTNQVGTIKDQIDLVLLKNQKYFYDTLWLYHDEKWYSLFKYQPIIRVFDHKLQLLEEQPVPSDFVNYKHIDQVEKATTKNANTLLHLFTDFKVHKGYLFAMTPGRLLQINKETWELVHTYSFTGTGEECPKSDSGEYLTLFFPTFTILKNDTIILGHPSLMWGHDLWKCKLPSIK